MQSQCLRERTGHNYNYNMASYLSRSQAGKKLCRGKASIQRGADDSTDKGFQRPLPQAEFGWQPLLTQPIRVRQLD